MLDYSNLKTNNSSAIADRGRRLGRVKEDHLQQNFNYRSRHRISRKLIRNVKGLPQVLSAGTKRYLDGRIHFGKVKLYEI